MNQSFRDASPFHGFLGQPQTPEQLKAIVETAVLAEREACAKLCEELGTATNGIYERNHDCAAAIRARGSNGS